MALWDTARECPMDRVSPRVGRCGIVEQENLSAWKISVEMKISQLRNPQKKRWENPNAF